MRFAKANTTLEELMGIFDDRKQKYTTAHGVIKDHDSDRYWRLDGIETGLKMAWEALNTKKTAKEISKEK